MSAPDPIDAFYRLFSTKTEEIETALAALSSSSPTDPGRATEIGNCLSLIAALQDTVQDASTYVPAYDQRRYTETLKTLAAKLDAARTGGTRKKFSFKPRERQAGRAKPAGSAGRSNPLASSDAGPASTPAAANATGPNDTLTVTGAPGSLVRLPAQPSYPNIHIADVTGCLVDLRPEQAGAGPLPSASLAALTGSVVVLPPTAGPVHASNLRGCVILIEKCAQLRLHDSVDCRIYLDVGTEPIVERVSRIGFGGLYGSQGGGDGKPKHEMTKDFNWLKPTPSPNWHVDANRGEDVITIIDEKANGGEQVTKMIEKITNFVGLPTLPSSV